MRGLWFCLLFSVVAGAQTPNTVVAGPYGVPRLVRTENGAWSEPIQVFSSSEKIAYVPDITTPGWAQWHAREFKEKGIYVTYVYTYLRKERVMVQDHVYVNTRTQHVTVQRFLKPPLQIDLRHSPLGVSTTLKTITKIVQGSVYHFKGPSLEDALSGDKMLTQHNLDVVRERSH